MKSFRANRFAYEVVVGFDLVENCLVVEIERNNPLQEAPVISLRLVYPGANHSLSEFAEQVTMFKWRSLDVVSVDHRDRHRLLYLEIAATVPF